MTRHGDAIVVAVDGSHDNTSAHELGKLVWPLAREGLAERRSAILDELGVAVGGQRSASTLGEVWRSAQEGRGATLVVEEGYHEAATIDDRGFLRSPSTSVLRAPLVSALVCLANSCIRFWIGARR